MQSQWGMLFLTLRLLKFPYNSRETTPTGCTAKRRTGWTSKMSQTRSENEFVVTQFEWDRNQT